jgi:predicted 3-demethylubiquinone-9 3-methyltransferase (glyoxalase superfamily)
MQKITPFLYFDGQAEEAANFYVSLFPDSQIVSVTHYGPVGPGPEGSVMTVAFRLAGQDFTALNGGPEFSFTPAISFMVNCETQAEVDDLWEKLTAGGEEVQCGWLQDKYGVSWQITPILLMKMLNDPDPVKVQRVMQAMMKMVKLDMAGLQAAYDEG